MGVNFNSTVSSACCIVCFLFVSNLLIGLASGAFLSLLSFDANVNIAWYAAEDIQGK